MTSRTLASQERTQTVMVCPASVRTKTWCIGARSAPWGAALPSPVLIPYVAAAISAVLLWPRWEDVCLRPASPKGGRDCSVWVAAWGSPVSLLMASAVLLSSPEWEVRVPLSVWPPPVGLIRGFQTLPSTPQSWDRSHCSVLKVFGVQYVQSEVHDCWLCGGLLCL